MPAEVGRGERLTAVSGGGRITVMEHGRIFV